MLHFGGNPEDVRALAGRVRTWAHDVESATGRVRAGRNVHWESTAANEFKHQLDNHAREFDTARLRVDAVADELLDLAHTLESRQRFLIDAFNRAKQEFEDGVEAAVEAGEDVARGAWHYANNAAGWASDNFRKWF